MFKVFKVGRSLMISKGNSMSIHPDHGNLTSQILSKFLPNVDMVEIL